MIVEEEDEEDEEEVAFCDGINFCGIILPLEHPISIVRGANPFGNEPSNAGGIHSLGRRVSPAPCPEKRKSPSVERIR